MTTYSGVTDAEKDFSCCQKCTDEPTCEFWVRATGNDQIGLCWLKKNFGADLASDNRRGAFRQELQCIYHVKAIGFVERIEPSNGLCVFELDRGNAPPCCAKWGFEKSGPGVVSWPFYGNNDQCSGGFIFQSDQEVLDYQGSGYACAIRVTGLCLTNGYYRRVTHSAGLRGEQIFVE